MQTVLITGGAGFVGFHLARHLASLGNEVTICDNLFRGSMDEEIKILLEKPNVRYVNCDLTDKDQVASLDSHDFVYHLAAVNGTKYFYEIPDQVLRINILSALNILEWFSEQKKGKILFTSSSETYAGTVRAFGATVPTPETVPLAVDDIFNPRWSYGISKIAGESLFINFARRRKFPMTIIRYHNIYGPRMGYEHVIPEFIMRLRSNETPFRIFGGKETRAFCFVHDAIRATQMCMESEKTENQIFHVGNDLEEIPIENLARKIFAIMEVRPELKIEPAPQGSVQRRCPDLTKIRKLGYTPSVPLDEGLQKTIDWYMKKTFKH